MRKVILAFFVVVLAAVPLAFADSYGYNPPLTFSGSVTIASENWNNGTTAQLWGGSTNGEWYYTGNGWLTLTNPTTGTDAELLYKEQTKTTPAIEAWCVDLAHIANAPWDAGVTGIQYAPLPKAYGMGADKATQLEQLWAYAHDQVWAGPTSTNSNAPLVATASIQTKRAAFSYAVWETVWEKSASFATGGYDVLNMVGALPNAFAAAPSGDATTLANTWLNDLTNPLYRNHSLAVTGTGAYGIAPAADLYALGALDDTTTSGHQCFVVEIANAGAEPVVPEPGVAVRYAGLGLMFGLVGLVWRRKR